MKYKRYAWWPYVKEIIRNYDLNRSRTLSGVSLADYEAVDRSIADMEMFPDGDKRMMLIRLLYWDKTHTLEGATVEIPCGRATAVRWQRQFFEAVARHRGLLDPKR